MEDIERLGENASELINKLSRHLERSRDLNDLFIRFADIDKLDVSEDVKMLIQGKVLACQEDTEN